MNKIDLTGRDFLTLKDFTSEEIEYLIDYATPWETKLSITKHIDSNKNFSELGLSWLAKNSSKIETNSDKIRA